MGRPGITRGNDERRWARRGQGMGGAATGHEKASRGGHRIASYHFQGPGGGLRIGAVHGSRQERRIVCRRERPSWVWGRKAGENGYHGSCELQLK